MYLFRNANSPWIPGQCPASCMDFIFRLGAIQRRNPALRIHEGGPRQGRGFEIQADEISTALVRFNHPRRR
jgi:hypothetical protein